MEASDTPLSTSPSPPSSSFSPQRHFYLAVDRLQFKMETLLGLLGMAGKRPCLPMVVCCSTRDELDAVCSSLSSLSSYVTVSPLYSDLSEVDRAEVLDNFREAATRWNKLGKGEEAEREANEERKSHVIVVTDACLPLLGSVDLPLCACMLINYELPTKKETYMKRMTAFLSADGLVISMVVGGEVVILKTLEENSGLVIAEMPINDVESQNNFRRYVKNIQEHTTKISSCSFLCAIEKAAAVYALELPFTERESMKCEKYKHFVL